MTNKYYYIKVLFLAALLAVLGKLIWKPSPDIPFPPNNLLPFFAVLALVEGIAFVIGVSFFIKVRRLIKQLPNMERIRYTQMMWAIAWILINWWAHDNLHMHNGEQLVGLLYIEYGFHVTLIASGIVLAHNFILLIQEKTGKINKIR